MQRSRLGQTDLWVSPIGLGTVKFGRNVGVKYPERFDLPDDVALERLLAQAQTLGINLLDTAPAYGESELRLGKLLAGKRHEWVLSSKAGETFTAGVSHYDFSKTAIITSVEKSLHRLKTDYLDILLIHSNGDDCTIIAEGIFDVLAMLKSAGKIRAYGMSTKTVAGGLQTILQADLAMVAYNFAYPDERIVIQEAHQQQKGILIKKAFASGHLGEENAESALRFVLRERGVGSVIIGTLNPLHLAENVMAINR